MPVNIPCGRLMKQIHDALEKQSNNALRSQDLTMAQVTALLQLNDLPDKQASLKELEQALRVAQSTTAGIITRLEQKDFVKSFGDPLDKRIKMVRLTQKGEQCCLNAKENMAATERVLLSGLSEKEKDTLNRLLQKVSDNMK